MEKYKKIIFGIIRLIKFYGPIIFLKVIFYEFFFLIKNKNNEILLDESQDREYTDAKNKIYKFD